MQMSMLLYLTIIATGIITLPAITAKYAGNDLWISPIIASLAGFLIVFIAVKLHNLYPRKTVMQYSEDIIGRIPGKVIGFFVLFFYMEITGNVIRSYSEFILTSFLFRTPLIFVIASMLILCAFCIYGRLEVLARCAQFLFPVFILPLFFSIAFLARDFQFGNILPVLENGIMPPLKAAIPPSGWFGEIFVIAFLLPYLADGKKGMKFGILSVLGAMLTLMIVNLAALFVLGMAISNKTYPLMNVIRYASLGSFFENIEAVIMAVWIVGAFVKISVLYYVLTLGTAQWLNLSDYRPVVWPIGILLVQFTYWGVPSEMALGRSDATDFPLYSFFIQLSLPLFLLVIALMRNKYKKKKVGKPVQT
ncbi:GerAB/ArcD/ProY family transporter [Sporosarcina koreensis]|uniref:GerAB/ArcD/ProY family transporter n=1 Tax=Bacillales TaxID=1385 RepID=UPI000B046376|nr:endospore germination permease [Sporosarcina koreensis]